MERRRAWRIALLVPLVVLLAACDWTQLGFDASHSGYNAYEPALTPSSVKQLTSAWTYADTATTDLLVAEGSVYTNERGDLDAPDVARALGVSNGALRWTVSNPPGARMSAVGNGLVYYDGGNGTTLARDTATGARRWSTAGTPQVLDGSRMFASTPSNVVALSPTGATLWSTPSSGEVISAAGRGGDLVVVSFVATQNAPGGFVVISTYDESDGSLLQRIGVVPKNADGTVDRLTGFSIGPKLIYLITPRDLFAVDPTTGAVVWHAPPSDGVVETPRGLLVNRTNTISGGTASASLLDPATGATRWQATFSGSIDGVAVAGDVAFIGHTSFDPLLGMLVYDLRDGTRITSSTVVCCAPIPAASHVFVAGANGLEALVPS